MVCNRCKKRGKPWGGSDPVCAFESGEASPINWRCATLEALWKVATDNDNVVYGDDCTSALIPIYGTGDRFIVLSCYKRRGQTDCVSVITDNGSIVDLALETAELVVGATVEEAPKVSYAGQIPGSVAGATARLGFVLNHGLPKLSDYTKDEFMTFWCAVVYLNPERHPDDCDEWPEDIQKLAIEAFRRRNVGELSDDELYPSAVIHARLGGGADGQ